MLRLLNGKSGQRDIKFDIAQAPAASEGGEEAEAEGHKLWVGAGLVRGWLTTRKRLEEMGQSMKGFLNKISNKPLRQCWLEAVATTFLESSSVTIIMLIAISAGVLTFAVTRGV